MTALKEEGLAGEEGKVSKTLKIEDAHLKMTPKGQFLSDGIASNLFIV